MAKYRVTYSCGHEREVQLFGPLKERDRKLTWLASQVCPDCASPARPKPQARLVKDGDHYRIQVTDAFPIKDYLKGIGYRWDPDRKAWWRPVNPADPADLVPAWGQLRDHVDPDADLSRLERAWESEQVRRYRTDD